MQGKARVPLLFWQAVDNSLAMTFLTLNLYPVMMALISTSLVWSTIWLWEVGIRFRFIESILQFCLGLEVWAADGFWVLALYIPLGALLAQLILDCVKVFILQDVDKLKDYWAVIGQVQYVVYCGGVSRHFPASYCDYVIAVIIIGIKFHDPVQICSG
ncbi:hypothetical protein V6N11_051406 [Hibiscus sabdariffa]|uniref:Uncharacterized protein n=1 Tax=Hibiscus sabdariffa TaxID=183260 RepID=A0ABR2U710_9ROSI